MSFDELARVYVNYIEPSFKAFLLFVVVMAVLAFWAKLKEDDFLDISKEIFEATVHYTYKVVTFCGMAIWFSLRFMGQVMQSISRTIKEFLAGRSK